MASNGNNKLGVLDALPGSKTYILGFLIVAYIVLQKYNGEAVDPEVIYGGLAGGLMTLRAAVTRAAAPEE
jgi:hypothetical protein